METLQAILTRRSIRSYTEQPITEEALEKILEAAMYAPTARNTQSWQFIVVDDRTILDTIPSIHPYAAMVKQASAAIAVCGDQRLESLEGYLALNCAAATQNILLAAHDLGYGTCWLGVYPRQERMSALTELLELPSHIVPISLIAVGVPKEIKPTPRRFLPDRIHWNRWTWDEPETGRL